MPGITTWVEPRSAVYLQENRTDSSIPIGRFDETLPGPQNRMAPCPEGLERLGIPALQRCLSATEEWVTLDEIGYLECGCEAYQAAVRELMKHKRVAAVVRSQELPFLQELCSRPDGHVVRLDAPYGQAGCVIMASGQGKRFGGNKLMADFHGMPVIQHVLQATEGIFQRRIVVTRHADVAAFCRKQAVWVIVHDLPLRSDTVRLGLQAMDGLDGCMFCAADQPLLTQETVAALALAGDADAQTIWRAACADHVGNPVWFPRWAFEELLHLPPGKGGGLVAQKYPEQVRTVPVRDAYELKDVDTQDDLRILLEQ